MKKYNKLVLFDIDGTLLNSVVPGATLVRFGQSIEKVHGVRVVVNTKSWGYNGVLDGAIIWDMLKNSGVSKTAHNRKLPEISREFVLFFDALLKKSGPPYVAIPDAVSLVIKLAGRRDIALGVLSGNLGDSARWKLNLIGVGKYLPFGLFGHEAETREELAKLIPEKAEKFFGQRFAPKDIVVIGDTEHDVRAGKAIGATTIAVTTGWRVTRRVLERERPDMLVRSLLAKPMRDFFGLV